MNQQSIIAKLPYSHPFLFVDELHHVNENGAKGNFTFNRELDFFKGHFKENAIVPGVILTECCAQIGLVCLGIYLLNKSNTLIDENSISIAFTSSEMEFHLPVLPDETVTVSSEKEYFRFNKLKCKVKMYNAKNELVCRGNLAGMFKIDTK
ncbi:3-hydroxyacyl-ACP dehydratase FabZ family protein [Costertonia aggregata]|uniref:Hydroxymyristoyl-ACP dehydratase n=1 Tax=Costertonia aggregata TaxID=343403 RepID=A0A7H9AUT5_9FLAO|nr:hydroxymyristoyl-ACP dehydratase [Costertonia aggregata]QLG46955.1 hydroxymyristoyl-ACP dehydratase [Costertonia aggregata]